MFRIQILCRLAVQRGFIPRERFADVLDAYKPVARDQKTPFLQWLVDRHMLSGEQARMLKRAYPEVGIRCDDCSTQFTIGQIGVKSAMACPNCGSKCVRVDDAERDGWPLPSAEARRKESPDTDDAAAPGAPGAIGATTMAPMGDGDIPAAADDGGDFETLSSGSGGATPPGAALTAATGQVGGGRTQVADDGMRTQTTEDGARTQTPDDDDYARTNVAEAGEVTAAAGTEAAAGTLAARDAGEAAAEGNKAANTGGFTSETFGNLDDDEEDLGVIPPGAVLGGCRIIQKIGQGGMGMVYKAHHQALDKPVAVKVLAPHLVENRTQILRFIREARAAGKLDHSNVVQVLNVGEENRRFFIVMQWITGTSLQKLIETEGVLAPDRAARYAAEAARGLHAAHKIGIIHRDIKPDNLMLTEDDVVKVADFGLAKPQDPGSDMGVSQTGAILGTPYYMSPEQGSAETVDHRSDIYSLGITLYQLLTGKVPFTGQSAVEIIFKHVRDEITAPRALLTTIPEALDAIVMKMVEKNPDDRYQDMKEVADHLTALIPHLSGHAPDLSVIGTPDGHAPMMTAATMAKSGGVTPRTMAGPDGASDSTLATGDYAGGQTGQVVVVNKGGSGGAIAVLVVLFLLLGGGAAYAFYFDTLLDKPLLPWNKKPEPPIAGNGNGNNGNGPRVDVPQTSEVASETQRMAEGRYNVLRNNWSEIRGESKDVQRYVELRKRVEQLQQDYPFMFEKGRTLIREIEAEREALAERYFQDLAPQRKELVGAKRWSDLVSLLENYPPAFSGTRAANEIDAALVDYRKRAADEDEARELIREVKAILLLDHSDVREKSAQASIQKLGEERFLHTRFRDEIALLRDSFAAWVEAGSAPEVDPLKEEYDALIQTVRAHLDQRRYATAQQTLLNAKDRFFGAQYLGGINAILGDLDDLAAEYWRQRREVARSAAESGDYTTFFDTLVPIRDELLAAQRAELDEIVERFADPFIRRTLGETFTPGNGAAARRLLTEYKQYRHFSTEHAELLAALEARVELLESGMVQVRLPRGGIPARGGDGARITLREFWIDRTEITKRDYYAFVQAGGYTTESLWSPEAWERVQSGRLRADFGFGSSQPAQDELTHPMSYVSWDEASAYARWAKKSLPTPEQWRIAAGWDPRAEEWRTYPWGDEFLVDGAVPAVIEKRSVEPVGTTPGDVSPFGVMDMGGNVSEWTTGGNETSKISMGANYRTRAVSRDFLRREAEAAGNGGLQAGGNGQATVGFRCVKVLPPLPPRPGADDASD
jgi:formylglycine-generating enzyme required for sulfatase activity/tRNA A-37 threonylcarbamoyl transferase component Bud32/DNA-directed RNA polymerase subunit RPC12/RpoP